MWGDRIAAGLAVAAFLFLAGVVYVGLTMPARPQEETYVLEIDARAHGETVVARGKTTLPDGSRLEVYVDRLYRGEAAGLEPLVSADAPVDGDPPEREAAELLTLEPLSLEGVEVRP